MRSLAAVLVGLLFLVNARCAVADGSQFRGANGNAVVTGLAHPIAWGPELNIAWSSDVPGRGWANPLILDGKVYIATAIAEPDQGNADSRPHRWQLRCYDLLSGAVDWAKTAKEGVPSIPTHRDNTYASESPVTDGQRIYVYFGMTGVYCYEKSGDLVWQKDLGSYPMRNGWGASSSPAVYDGRLFVQVDNEEKSFLVALDANNGDELWRVDRDEQSNWSSVIVWKNRERTELVTGGKLFRSYEPDTGKVLWTLDAHSARASSTPAATEDLLIVGAEDRSRRGGGRGGVFAVKPGAEGDLSPASDEDLPDGLLWSNLDTPMGIASPLIYEGCVYVAARNGGIVTCLDAQTGEQLYRERVRAAAFWASPWAAAGRVFLPDDRGQVVMLAPGKQYTRLGANTIDGRLWATPACADGSLVLRYEDRLVCVRASDGA